MVLVGAVDFDVTFFAVDFVVLVGTVDFDVTFFVVGFVVLVGAVDFDVTLIVVGFVDVADFTAADLVLVVCFVLGTCVDVIVGFVLDNEVLVVETCECVVFVMFFFCVLEFNT